MISSSGEGDGGNPPSAVHQAASAASFCALAIASSMVPTM
jgi:hypothetical protein